MLRRKLWLFAAAILTASALLGVATPGPRIAKADEPQDAGAFAAFTDLMVISEFLMNMQATGQPIYVNFTGETVSITGMQPMAGTDAYEIATYDFMVGEPEVTQNATQMGENRLTFSAPEGFVGEVAGAGEGRVITGMSGPGATGIATNTGEIGTPGGGGGTTNGGLPLGMGGLRDIELEDHRNSPASFGWGPFQSLIMASPSPCPNNSNQPCTAYISWFHDTITQTGPCNQACSQCPTYCSGGNGCPQYCTSSQCQQYCVVQLKTKIVWREMYPTPPGAQRIYGPWYSFTNLTMAGSQTQIPFSVGYGRKYEFRLQDMTGVMLAHMEVSSGINGELLGAPAPCHLNGQPFCVTGIVVEGAPPITVTQTWVQCANTGPDWYFFAWGYPGYDAVPAYIADHCTFEVGDNTPGPTNGTVIQTKTFAAMP